MIARGVERFAYVYDYGDNSRHEVVVGMVRDGDPDVEYPVFVDGVQRCPSEDVGEPDGFMDFLGAILGPAQEERRAMLDWYGGPFDPIGFDKAQARLGGSGGIATAPPDDARAVSGVRAALSDSLHSAAHG